MRWYVVCKHSIHVNKTVYRIARGQYTGYWVENLIPECAYEDPQNLDPEQWLMVMDVELHPNLKLVG